MALGGVLQLPEGVRTRGMDARESTRTYDIEGASKAAADRDMRLASGSFHPCKDRLKYKTRLDLRICESVRAHYSRRSSRSDWSRLQMMRYGRRGNNFFWCAACMREYVNGHSCYPRCGHITDNTRIHYHYSGVAALEIIREEGICEISSSDVNRYTPEEFFLSFYTEYQEETPRRRGRPFHPPTYESVRYDDPESDSESDDEEDDSDDDMRSRSPQRPCRMAAKEEELKDDRECCPVCLEKFKTIPFQHAGIYGCGTLICTQCQIELRKRKCPMCQRHNPSFVFDIKSWRNMFK